MRMKKNQYAETKTEQRNNQHNARIH